MNKEKRYIKITRWIISFFLLILYILANVYIIMSYREKIVLNKLYSFILVELFLLAFLVLLQCRLHGVLKGRKLKSKLLNIIYFLSIPIAALLIEELIWNDSFMHMSLNNIFINYCLVAILTMCLSLIIKKAWCAYTISLIFHWLYGLVNHYVLVFRGQPPLYTDFVVAKTAISVMGNYTFKVTDCIIYGTLLLLALLLVIAFLIPADITIQPKRKQVKILVCIIRFMIPVILIIGVLNINIGKMFKLDINPWNPLESMQRNGAPISMLISIQNTHPSEPEEYSKTEAQKILNKYEITKSVSEESKEKPLVIVIMNESFSDLNVFGKIDSEDSLKYWNSLDTYIMRGNVYTSTVGGGTCNSEFEFLTGNTMANINDQGYPYRNYNLKSTYNIAKYLKDEHGYNSVAFHPYYADNWNRTIVYKNFGFDDFISSEDMSDEEFSYIGWGESDDADYDKVIQIVENNQQQPLFLFNVTMQNHGGYLQDLQAGYELVSVADKYAGYKDVVNYLTLIRESDHAYEKLITYLEGLDRPVLLCMFGDHQPALDDAFVEDITSSYSGDSEIEKRQQRYITPYMIWSNYDTGVEQMQKDMSLNYLGANLLDIMGYRTSYTNYLLNLETEIPVMNAVGYQTKDDVWHGWEEENNLINEYKIVQYYETFDRNDTEY